MTDEKKITHADVREFLDGRENDRVQLYREQNPGYRLLFDILSRINTGDLEKDQFTAEKSFGFSEIDDLLDSLVSGTIRPADERKFVTQLYHSPDFFAGVQVRLEQMSAMLAETPEQEMQQVAIKSDDELLAKMGVLSSVPGQAEKAGTQKIPLAEKFKLWLDNIFPLQRYAYVVAAMLLLIISIPVVIYNLRVETVEEDILAKYTYDDKVPYGYSISNLRDVVSDSAEIAVYRIFVDQFNLAMIEYLLTNYEEAITKFILLTEISTPLNENEKYGKYRSVMHDLHLYFGLCQFAIARSPETLPEVQKEHFNDCLKNLIKAKHFLSSDIKARTGIEDFFIGLTYIFLNDQESGIRHLKLVSKNSDFYDDSRLILNRITNSEDQFHQY